MEDWFKCQISLLAKYHHNQNTKPKVIRDVIQVIRDIAQVIRDIVQVIRDIVMIEHLSAGLDTL